MSMRWLLSLIQICIETGRDNVQGRNRMTCMLISIIWFVLLFFVTNTSDVFGYVGPGAGFAVVSSFFTLFATGILTLCALLVWPFRAFLRYLKLRKIQKRRKAGRVVVLGLDGMDPGLTQQFLDDGRLPNFRFLRDSGTFKKLLTTIPSISPVAWSTFSTGVNPGKHRIFDFYTRNPRNYLPVLSSVHISSSYKTLKIGPLAIPRARVNIKFLRKSKSVWKILGECGVFCNVLRVPISFPPEKFYGTCLSAMCAPDLLGTQGSFTLLSAEKSDSSLNIPQGGTVAHLRIGGQEFSGEIKGPTVEYPVKKTLTLPFTGRINLEQRSVHLKISQVSIVLREGIYSDWIQLAFKSGLRRRIYGIARLLVTQMEPLKIYVSPINIHPEKPILPVSNPKIYSVGLSKLHGRFATLGLAEDTWALNARVIDEGAFLKQAYDIYDERKKHFIDTLKKNRNGLVVSVFDTTDRIQHMFFRYLDPDHPANKNKDTEVHKNAIEQLYVRMDGLLGEVLKLLHKDDVLFVISDHGFQPFKWGVNLNSWLWREGYLVLKEGATLEREWLADVDWAKTRAYAYGLSGIFINLTGRERAGIVNRGYDRTKLCEELRHKLLALEHSPRASHPIRRVIFAEEAMKGPYVEEAPDLLIGYERGYRVSWNSAVGKITGSVFEENNKSWSGDHSIDPDLVPGVLFCNREIRADKPSIADLAPTILNLFGLKKLGFHDGHVLPVADANRG